MRLSLSTRLKHISSQGGNFPLMTSNRSGIYAPAMSLCSPLRKMIFLNANSTPDQGRIQSGSCLHTGNNDSSNGN